MIDSSQDRERIIPQPIRRREVMNRSESRKLPLVERIMVNGKEVTRLDENWESKGLEAVLLRTRRNDATSETLFVIEPGHPSLVTRIIDMHPYFVEQGIGATRIIDHTSGSTNNALEVGMQVDIFGEPAEGTGPDPAVNPNHPLHVTPPIVKISYLEAGS